MYKSKCFKFVLIVITELKFNPIYSTYSSILTLILHFRYLHDPVLFDREEIGMVKFDIRYILLLHTVKPLQVYAYNRFWLRFANQEFELKDLDVYEKHFTVMNYKEAHLEQVRYWIYT